MDHDRFFKLLLTTFFMEFIKLFLPDVAKCVDRRSIRFLSHEIFTDIASGERHVVDLLVKVRFRGRPAYFLIHVETQSWSERGFARRMFEYFAPLHKKYRVPVYPVVIFSYDKPLKPGPTATKAEFPDLRVLDFCVQDDPTESTGLARLRPQPQSCRRPDGEDADAPGDRPRVKLECSDAGDISFRQGAALIGTFMDSYLNLRCAGWQCIIAN